MLCAILTLLAVPKIAPVHFRNTDIYKSHGLSLITLVYTYSKSNNPTDIYARFPKMKKNGTDNDSVLKVTAMNLGSSPKYSARNIEQETRSIHSLLSSVSMKRQLISKHMKTSSNGNNLREFPGDQWIPRTKASEAELLCFLWSA